MKKNNINISFDSQTSSLDLPEDLRESLVLYSIKHMISDSINGMVKVEIGFMENFINEENFDCLWNNLPDSRSDLLTVLSNISNYGCYYSLFLLSKEFSIKKLKEIEVLLAKDESIDSNIERIRVIKAINEKFDYLGEIDRLVESNASQDVINLWIESSLGYLNLNENSFSKLYSKVKRSSGSCDLKSKILSLAIDKNILLEKEIKGVAESSPINLKRKVVYALATCKQRSEYIKSEIRIKREDADREKYVLDLNTKSEELMMKFSSTKDSSILNVLVENISSKNLPWILPLVSSYPYLVKKAQKRINRGV